MQRRRLLVLSGALIVGLVAFVVWASSLKLWGQSNQDRARFNTKEIYLAAVRFQKDFDRVPTIEDLTTPNEMGHAYLESSSDDPWGRPYVIEELGPSCFRVISYGPNAEGSDDDIVYPPRSRDDA